MSIPSQVSSICRISNPSLCGFHSFHPKSGQETKAPTTSDTYLSICTCPTFRPDPFDILHSKPSRPLTARQAGSTGDSDSDMLLAGTVPCLTLQHSNHSLARKLHVTHPLDGGPTKKSPAQILYPSISLSRAISQSLIFPLPVGLAPIRL
ncbi:hypothetical protein BDP81DRAFT_85393 [Colletotrichum phormii]|uniref:Uncharacterized protein n=1 Tax=Colletotrichum phormii TaxID=359342 RepID=A0AAJ0A4Q3_9PEZI|nr:uncharacterized protein BDP81DRAFT_85393 [Colletotrichum phormii]KAK1654565.1 hypothetical protein BDP81DRAFT_85393 [Colletotrichum phormii]